MADDVTSNSFDLNLRPLAAKLSAEAATTVAESEFSPEVQQRLDELADKSTAGTLSPTEREEYAALVTALDSVAISHAQARRRAERPS
jgi:hypothetical protein